MGGAELEGLALAGVPRLNQAGLSEHVTLINVTPGPVVDPGLDSTCPSSNYPLLLSAPPGLSSRQAEGGGGVKAWEYSQRLQVIDHYWAMGCKGRKNMERGRKSEEQRGEVDRITSLCYLKCLMNKEARTGWRYLQP